MWRVQRGWTCEVIDYNDGKKRKGAEGMAVLKVMT